MRIDVTGICQGALDLKATEENLDEKILQICRNLYGREYATPMQATVRAINHHAEQFKQSRMASVGDLAESTTVVEVRTWTSGEDLPDDVQKRIAEVKASGRPQVVERVVRRTWDPSQGPPDDEILRMLPDGVRVKRGKTGTTLVVKKQNSTLTRFLLLLLLLIVGVSLPLIRLWWNLKGPGAATASLQLEKQVQELEARYAKDPDDLETAMELSEAYARKLVFLRSITGLKRLKPAEDFPDLSDELEESLARLEEAMGFSASEAELEATAVKAEELVRGLLAGEDMPVAVEGTLQIHLGHFLLAQDRIKEAEQASRRAAELDASDPRPHMLNADICEQTKDYQRAIDENRSALAKLSAWVEKDPSLLRYISWAMTAPQGRSAFAQEGSWRKKKQKIAANIQQGIEMHIMSLRTLDKASKLSVGTGQPASRSGR